MTHSCSHSFTLLSWLAVLFGLAYGAASLAAPPKGASDSHFTIEAAKNSQSELAAARQLEEILSKYDLSRWAFTKDILIEEGAIPRSHPRLTHNTQYLNDDNAQLATFIHEHVYWHLTFDRDAIAAALGVLKREFPDVPIRLPQGARDKDSKYIHLAVCYMEYHAIRQLVGESEARRVLLSFPYHRWIYRTVIDRKDHIVQGSPITQFASRDVMDHWVAARSVGTSPSWPHPLI